LRDDRLAQGMQVQTPGPDLDTLSIHRSFVVRIYPDPGLPGGRLRGLVEHVVSGEASEFQSIDDLLRFIRHVLAGQQPERPWQEQ
jgi:hypothetical protein